MHYLWWIVKFTWNITLQKRTELYFTTLNREQKRGENIVNEYISSDSKNLAIQKSI